MLFESGKKLYEGSTERAGRWYIARVINWSYGTVLVIVKRKVIARWQFVEQCQELFDED